MTDMTPAQTPMETHMTVVKALLRCGGRMTIDSLPGDASMAAYNISADVQEALAAALDLLAKRDAELARVREALAEATDPDFIWDVLSDTIDIDVSYLDLAKAVSAKQRAALTPEPEGDAE